MDEVDRKLYENVYERRNEILVGDIIFYESKTLLGGVIRHITKYKYSHVAIVVEVTATDIWVIEAVAFKKSKVVSLFKDENIKSLRITRANKMDDEKRKIIYKIKDRFIGHKYDHIGVLHLMICVLFPGHKVEHALLKTSGKWCSAIVDEMVFKTGIDLVPDREDHLVDIKTLAESDELTMIKIIQDFKGFRYLN